MKNFINELISWSIYIVSTIALVIIITTFIVQPTQVDGKSMLPTLKHEERLFISKIPHTLKKPYSYGDIVVIDSRVNRHRKLSDDLLLNFKNNLITAKLTGNSDNYYWVKRVIGKEGDTIEFESDKIKRNGKVLKEKYLDPESTPFYQPSTITVPKGYVFVLGDNRNYSSDSRIIGCVPVENVIGKYWFTITK